MKITSILSSFLFVLLSSVISYNTLFAGTAELLFEAGNRAYIDGDYMQALDKWTQVEKLGIVDGMLFYNLGNVYFKSRNLGKAILYWEKASRLIGEDGDLAVNLAIAKTQLVDKLDDQVRLPVWSLFDRIRNRFPVNILAMVSLFMSTLFFGLLSLNRWVINSLKWRQRIRVYNTVVLFILFINFALIGLKARDESLRMQGIVIATQTEVISAPAEGSGKLLFTLHEGTKVRVLRRLGKWIEVAIGKDKQGWLREDTIGII